MKQIGSGAEAIIFLEDKRVIKKRIKKNYRIEEIDFVLRRSRTRNEAKILAKIPINAPKILSNDKLETLEMEFIDGQKIRDILDKNPILAKEIGKNVGLMHNFGIIHSDLTTSNMIQKRESIYFIDFGLSFFSKRIEDKAVDIHLFKQALDSKHYKISEEAFKHFLEGYKNANNYENIINRLKVVDSRGRYKKK